MSAHKLASKTMKIRVKYLHLLKILLCLTIFFIVSVNGSSKLARDGLFLKVNLKQSFADEF